MQFDNNLTILVLVDFQAIYRYIFRAEKKQPIRKRTLIISRKWWMAKYRKITLTHILDSSSASTRVIKIKQRTDSIYDINKVNVSEKRTILFCHTYSVT